MHAAQSSSSTQAPQKGMVNPPRKVKRLRELASRDPDFIAESTTPSTAPLSQTEQRIPSLPASARPRGRKPAGPMSRAAREQQRKTNHSVIEKRRREKINEALTALRELVPNDKPDGEEKEFKLEVLVRTVEHLRMMVTKVKDLGGERICPKCGEPVGAASNSDAANGRKEAAGVAAGKRKRSVQEDVQDDDCLDISDEDIILPPTPLHAPSSPTHNSPRSSQSRPNLPSISTWLLSSPDGGPAVTPSQSPSHPYQLPSPPQSAPFVPQTSTDVLPRLTLPPGLRLSASPTIHGHAGSSASSVSDRDVPDLPLEHHRRASTTRPTHVDENRREGGGQASPWTRDDQTAASLLLNISSRSAGATQRDTPGVVREAQTPSSVLGMGEGQCD